ncbi:MAG: hypothetical protein AAFO98_08710, partial [Pseudomonadota bacterium]
MMPKVRKPDGSPVTAQDVTTEAWMKAWTAMMEEGVKALHSGETLVDTPDEQVGIAETTAETVFQIDKVRSAAPALY